MQTLPAVANDLGRRRGQLWEDMFLFTEPGPPQRLAIQHIVGNEAAQLGVVVHFGGLVKVILRPRSAIGDQQSRRVEDAGFGERLDHILIQEARWAARARCR